MPACLSPGPAGGPAVPVNPPPPPVGAGEPPGTFPSIPGMNMTDVGPDRNDPFPNRSFADIVTSVEEAPTGRFMIGVGANSFQGLMGNVQIYEKNFDIFNVPRSFSDITNGQAFRGGGQALQVNLQAGNLINMMSVSLREPYLFDLPIGASATGYLYSRIYPNWDERRGGGRFSLGRQVGTSMYADLAVRAEEVDFFGYRSPAPANYLAASGFTSLFSIRPSLRFDNRNSPFMATKGQYLQVSAEQGFGSFTWTKFDAEGRMYIPTGSRPDGTGKRFFTLRGHFGIATESTPVYERYFAGNFGSLRGFQYRTVSPHAFGVPTGGVMMAVGSVEYQFPWNARDTFHQIFFTDFGTVTRQLRVQRHAGLGGNRLEGRDSRVRPHAVRVRPGVPGPQAARRQSPVSSTSLSAASGEPRMRTGLRARQVGPGVRTDRSLPAASTSLNLEVIAGASPAPAPAVAWFATRDPSDDWVTR